MVDLSKVKEVKSIIFHEEYVNIKLKEGWVLIEIKIVEEVYWKGKEYNYNDKGFVAKKSSTHCIIGRVE